MIDSQAAGTADSRPLGELLVAQGLLSREQLASALAQQAATGRPIGEVLVTLGFVAPEHIAQALATQQGGASTSEYGIALAFGADAAGPSVVAPPPITGPSPEPAAGTFTDLTVQTFAPPQPVVTPVAQPVAVAPAPDPNAAAFTDLTLQAPPPPQPAPDPNAVTFTDLTLQVASPPQPEAPPAPEPVAVAETETLRAELASLAAARDALATELELARQESQEHADAATEAANLRVQVEELRGMADHVGTLQAAVGDAEARAAAVQAQLDTVLAEREALQQQVAESAAGAGEQVTTLQAERDDALHRLETLRAERDALQQQVADSAAGAGERAAALQAERDDALHQLETLRAERDALQEQLAGLVAERNELRRELHERSEALATANATRADDQVGDRLATLESRLDQAVDLLGALGSVGELERKLAAAEATNDAARQSLAGLERQLAERTRAYDELLDRLHSQHRPAAATTEDGADEGPYFVFATVGGRYDLVELDGPVPRPGDSVELDGKPHTVVRVGKTPGADRPTVYTQPA